MKRRVIKQKTAYTLTLPIEWVRSHNLKPKEEIDLEEEGDTLVISTEKRPTNEEISLKLEKSTPDYYRIMIENHYRKGYDLLRISFDDKKAMQYIQDTVANLIGFEIIEQKENSCQITSTSQSTPDQFKTLLNRVFNIITYTQSKVIEDLEKNTFESLDEIERQSKDVRRFMLFCTRAIHKSSIVPRREESYLHLLLERLILIEHNHYYLYKKISGIAKPKIKQEAIELYKKSTEMFNLFKQMFFKKDLKNFAKVNELWKEIYFEKGHELFERCTKAESIVIFHAMHLSKLVFLISQPSIALQEIK